MAFGVVFKALRIIRAESDDLRSRFDALRAAKDENDKLNARDISTLENRLAASEADRESLSRFVDIRDTATEAERIRKEAVELLASVQASATEALAAAQQEASRSISEAQADAKQTRSEADQMVSRASLHAAKVIEDARKRAKI